MPGFAGINGIPVTPFRQGGEIDYDKLAEIVRRMAASKVDVVVACGNTSEYAALTSTEAVEVARTTIDATVGSVSLVGVGGDVATAVREAKFALARGATGIMVHYPSDVYVSGRGLIEYYERIILGADGPIVLYVRDRGLPFEVLDKVLRFENVVAVKYAVPDILGFGSFVREFGSDVVALCGLAEMWAPFFSVLGAKGFTSGLVNVAPTLSLGMWSELHSGNMSRAMELWQKIRPFEELRGRHRSALNVSVVKAAMVCRGFLVDASVRPPIAELSQAEMDEVRHVVNSWNLSG
ncbi:MAG: dihydrodipicolinate synthase family protein [Actinomycetota bacterium]|nr:dihydrodipicolinate synthase family protein [Actinomycetota bacterium]